MTNEKVYAMSIAKVYPLLVAKAEKKGRTRQEVDEIICWLTGYSLTQLQKCLDDEVSYEQFFSQATCLNENRYLIKGKICGVDLETIEQPLMQNIRYLDKLVDELAKGRKMEKILRQ